jgi:hypothetical protein
MTTPGLFASVLGCLCLLASTAVAERAPLSAEQLVKESDLVVVGQITNLTVGTERSRIERGFGNYDWAIDLTLKITAVEKGTLASSNTVVARCFRIKSRKSMTEYLSVGGNYPIPGVGTAVRAHLYQRDGRWRVVFPNGLAPVSDRTALTDAAAVGALRGGGYTYLLPLELWVLIVLILVIATIVLVLVKRLAGLFRRRD